MINNSFSAVAKHSATKRAVYKVRVWFQRQQNSSCGDQCWSRSRLHAGQAIDSPLSETGLQQAEAAGRYLREVKFSHAFASDMLRAKQVGTNIKQKQLVCVHIFRWNFFKNRRDQVFQGLSSCKPNLSPFFLFLDGWNDSAAQQQQLRSTTRRRLFTQRKGEPCFCNLQFVTFFYLKAGWSRLLDFSRTLELLKEDAFRNSKTWPERRVSPSWTSPPHKGRLRSR